MKSLAILLLGVVVYFLIVGSFGYTEPPGPPPVYYSPELWGSFVFLPVLWFATRFWYCLPVFFGYGALVMYPLSWMIFGPKEHHGFVGPIPPNCELKTFAFCCITGLLAVFIASLSNHALLSKLHAGE